MKYIRSRIKFCSILIYPIFIYIYHNHIKSRLYLHTSKTSFAFSACVGLCKGLFLAPQSLHAKKFNNQKVKKLYHSSKISRATIINKCENAKKKTLKYIKKIIFFFSLSLTLPLSYIQPLYKNIVLGHAMATHGLCSVAWGLCKIFTSCALDYTIQ